MNSLNQIDYSHLKQQQQQQEQTNHQLSPKQDIYSRDRLNHVNENQTNKSNVAELKEENTLMQAMIERLMEENAQLRAEKMITASNSSSTSNNISQNINNLFYNPSQAEDISLYSTVKNKKFNIFNTNDQNSKVNIEGIDDYQTEKPHSNKESPTHSNNHHKAQKQYQQQQYQIRCQQQQSYSKKVYLAIDSSDTTSNDHNSIKKNENTSILLDRY